MTFVAPMQARKKPRPFSLANVRAKAFWSLHISTHGIAVRSGLSLLELNVLHLKFCRNYLVD